MDWANFVANQPIELLHVSVVTFAEIRFGIELLDEVTYEQVADVARRIADELSIACVGPHGAEEFG